MDLIEIMQSVAPQAADAGKVDDGDERMLPFQPAFEKLTLASLDDTQLEVEAQYNPKELQIERSIPWGQHGNDNGPGGRKPGEEGQVQLEYTGGSSRSLSIELLFDTFEKPSKAVVEKLAALEELATVRDPTSKREDMRRPHHCVISWGDKGMPRFTCVIESLVVKYTAFSHRGLPLRAVATVKLKEADRAYGQRGGKGPSGSGGSADSRR